MKSIFKIITLSTAILGAGLLINGQAEASSITKSDVITQVNDTVIPASEVQSVWVDKESLFVPIRPLSEKAGYGLDWYNEGGESVVTFTHGDNIVTVKTNDHTATVNGKPVKMDKAPFKVEGYTYVPLRFIGESLGHLIQWDQSNGLAILATDGKFHAPAYYRYAAAELSNQIIETAKLYLGVPYVYGGTTPSGFDCSGFLQYVFNQYGIDLPRTAADMYASAGTHVKGNLERGDLVFFKQGSKVSHVGMYIGNNQYIDASSGSRMRVTFSDLGSSWSMNYYIGAKRVL